MNLLALKYVNERDLHPEYSGGVSTRWLVEGDYLLDRKYLVYSFKNEGYDYSIDLLKEQSNGKT